MSRLQDLGVHEGYCNRSFLLKKKKKTLKPQIAAKPENSSKGLMYRVLFASWSQRPRPFRDNKWLPNDWPMLVVDHRFVPNLILCSIRRVVQGHCCNKGLGVYPLSS